MSVIEAARNEQPWLRIARQNPARYENGTLIADNDIPPPKEAESAMFVADCLNAARQEDPSIPPAPDTIGELTMYGKSVDLKRTPPQIGMIVIINQPSAWIPARRDSPAAKLPNNAKSHVGFLVRSTLGQVYVLGEGCVRCFPKKAIGTLRSVL